MKEKRPGLIGIFLLTALLLAIFWIGGFQMFLSGTNRLKDTASPEKTDAIVVLTGGPSRINEGLDLLQSQRAGKLLISGVDPSVSVTKILSMWGKGFICCISLGYEAHNTRENAAETRKWAEKENVRSILLVTSLYHMPRALMEMRHALPGVTFLPYPVETEKEPLSLEFEEYNKVILTWLRLTFAS